MNAKWTHTHTQIQYEVIVSIEENIGKKEICKTAYIKKPPFLLLILLGYFCKIKI